MEHRIEEIISGYYAGSDKFLVQISVKPGNTIAVFIDGDRGITIDDCKELARHIESKLDRNKEDYELMVSSAGADKPMTMPRQFLKHVGRHLIIDTTTGTVLTGKLVKADQVAIELEHKPEKKEKQHPNTSIPFNQIKEGKVVLSFK